MSVCLYEFVCMYGTCSKILKQFLILLCFAPFCSLSLHFRICMCTYKSSGISHTHAHSHSHTHTRIFANKHVCYHTKLRTFISVTECMYVGCCLVCMCVCFPAWIHDRQALGSSCQHWRHWQALTECVFGLKYSYS